VPGGVFTKINFNVTSFNVGGGFNTSSSQFAPTTAGYYSISSVVMFTGNPGGSNTGVAIYKNGSLYSETFNCPGTPASIGSFINDIVPLDVGDYVEIFAVQSTGGALNADAGAPNTFFAGTLLYQICTVPPSATC